ncbi:hypothetical protein FW774_02770 (plasmid) [Pedobacter sp. BS3]|uniref:hypothetical protein n=1 Tax=Pedobacter sp. BS3 TaxID=2567937 RepID=UPI0011EF4CEF|nr:hypothetical protein [Pedobacter sp. BS3]TZF86001.1 hypothetical protein FW774_02770 [Pedobacter sp. BS3]
MITGKHLCVWFLFLAGTWACLQAFAQAAPYPVHIDVPAVHVAADNLDQVYLVTAKGELLKYSPSGKLLWRYSNKSFGEITSLDVTDPMRITLFYSGLQQLVVLNNTLSEIARYNFRKDINKQVTLAATANNNGYWIYDQNNRELHKLTNDFNDDQRSGNIYQQTGINISPDILLANDQYVYLHDARQGVLLFDRFGAYIKTVLTDNLTDLQVKYDWLMYRYGNVWKSMNTQTYESSSEKLPVKDVKQVAEGSKIRVFLTDSTVYVYPAEDKSR